MPEWVQEDVNDGIQRCLIRKYKEKSRTGREKKRLEEMENYLYIPEKKMPFAEEKFLRQVIGLIQVNLGRLVIILKPSIITQPITAKGVSIR